MRSPLELIRRYRLVPVVVIDDEQHAVPLADALCIAGLPLAEVTFRTSAAAGAIRAMREAQPDMLVGAGTVLTVGQVDSAIDAGASFIVSPGFDPEVVQYCLAKNVPVIPGVMTPTELQTAGKAGLGVVKFFPAEAAGGVKFLRALSAPFHTMQFIPTGGIEPSNLRSYLNLKCVAACGGSWMVGKDLMKAGEFREIARLTKEALRLASLIGS